ncbi:hypothetical protein CPLU01_12466 [Colletotrichum plurivorum]|uniref:Uncharacterized protein n=1 Tax=Colletotrichum plurivorum TaxID=2175906 RepID=A0A8H6JXW9_9PEZI|nr:hypothetical protein CPLU01_12466 [Colletotrichum plurivorum]
MSTIPARIATTALRAPLQRPGFSTSARLRFSAPAGSSPKNNGSKNKPDDVEMPAFNLGHITTKPLTRRLLIATFCVLASIEAYGWFNFGPKILGWEKREDRK